MVNNKTVVKHSTNKMFRLYGVYKDINESFFLKNVYILIDYSDVINNNLQPTTLYFKDYEKLIEYKNLLLLDNKKKDLKIALKELSDNKYKFPMHEHLYGCEVKMDDRFESILICDYDSAIKNKDRWVPEKIVK